MLVEYRGRQRTKFLTKFHAGIELLADVRPAGVRQDRTVAERARSELGPALNPAQDFPLRKEPRGSLGSIALAHRELRAGEPLYVLQRRGRHGGAQIRKNEARRAAMIRMVL